ncbi:MAG: hypothetical protein J6S20_03830 [Paludibacteraceae bacterium]|jgi:hypothetical protein|nr:hypothetical protein [Paludibacteraceae bacterium]
METFLEICKYILPSVVTLIAVAVVLRKMLNNEEARREFELRKQNASAITPIRLRGYERMVLFLERTQPNSLLMRQDLSQKTCFQLQKDLLNQIRSEFDHNVAQQIYVSREAWSLVVNAKESLLKLVNISAAKFPADEKSIRMAEFMIQTYSQTSDTPTEKAINFLRNEIKANF